MVSVAGSMATPSGVVKAGPTVMVRGGWPQPVVVVPLQVAPSMTETVFPPNGVLVNVVSAMDGQEGLTVRTGPEQDRLPVEFADRFGLAAQDILVNGQAIT